MVLHALTTETNVERNCGKREAVGRLPPSFELGVKFLQQKETLRLGEAS